MRDKLLQILAHSMSKSLSSTEHSVDEYIEMIDSRQALFDELAELARQTSQELEASSGTSSGNIELDAEIREIANKIAAREAHHNKQVAGIMTDLKKGLKEISNEKSINSMYSQDSYQEGSLFNSKN